MRAFRPLNLLFDIRVGFNIRGKGLLGCLRVMAPSDDPCSPCSNGKENGNFRDYTGVIWGIWEYAIWGCIVIMEKKMETTVFRMRGRNVLSPLKDSNAMLSCWR